MPSKPLPHDKVNQYLEELFNSGIEGAHCIHRDEYEGVKVGDVLDKGSVVKAIIEHPESDALWFVVSRNERLYEVWIR